MTPEPTPEVKQARMKEFMQLLPITLELAGLPKCAPDRLFTADQIEARITSLKIAYKSARQLLRDVGEGT